jgi:C4-dicarboxylate-specific signal transduction histidine kinase
MNNELVILGLSTHLLIIVGLASSTLSYYIQVLNKRHENQLQVLLKERNDQLLGQSKYSELGMMSAGIAHEINNPLAIIQAKTTQLLRFYRDPARQREMAEGLEQILYTSERINRTIQGVREFVHQDESVKSEDIPLKTLIDDVMAFCGQRMKNHGINLRFYGLDHFSVRGHKIQLEQVLLNLLNNSFDAIEFLPDKWIEISVHDTPGTIQIFMKDSGSGIPPEVAKRMMEPFFTTKNIKKGTGLGLALARGIVEKHGGTLTYVAQEKHTTFLVELPKRVTDYIPVQEYQRPVIH